MGQPTHTDGISHIYTEQVQHVYFCIYRYTELVTYCNMPHDACMFSQVAAAGYAICLFGTDMWGEKGGLFETQMAYDRRSVDAIKLWLCVLSSVAAARCSTLNPKTGTLKHGFAWVEITHIGIIRDMIYTHKMDIIWYHMDIIWCIIYNHGYEMK